MRTSAQLPSFTNPMEPIWVRAVLEPVAIPLTRLLVRTPWLTPNRLTAIAGLFGVASAAAFLHGSLLLGAVLFELRFLVDCLDGMVARARRLTSARGAAFDLATDVVTITLAYAGLALYAVENHGAAPALIAVLAGGSAVSAWMIAARKPLVHLLGEPAGPPEPGGRGGLLGRYADWMKARGMTPLPYTVEAETFGLFLTPAIAAFFPGLLVPCLLATAAFYVASTFVNAARLLRVAGRLDRLKEAHPLDSSVGPAS